MPLYSNLTVIAGPKAEPVSLELAKRHLRVDHDDDDQLIQLYLTSAREWVENYLAVILPVQQFYWVTAVKPYLGATPFIALPFPVQINPLWFPWPGTLNSWTDLPRWPVQSLDQVAVGYFDQPDTILTPSQVAFDPDLGRFKLLFGSTTANTEHTAVTFTAGFKDPAEIPQSIIFGILMLLAYMYENRGDLPVEAPVHISRLLTMHRRLTFGA